MKKIIFITSLLILSISSLQAQNINLSEEEVNVVLCHTWKLDSAIIKGKKMQINVNFEVIFNTDKSYFLVSNPNTIGTWKYNKVNKNIELQIKDRASIITSLKEKEFFIIEIQKDEYSKSTPSDSEFHFIRNE